jgi:flagellar biosynthesis anti-sigma factor FlgM
MNGGNLAMKVEHSGSNKLIQNQPENVRPVEYEEKSTGELHPSKQSASLDKATLSSQAQSIAKARSSFDEISDVRTERVQDIKERIEAGKYEIPMKELVDRLIRSLKVE